MIRSIENAAKNFCMHQLNMKCSVDKEYNEAEKFIAYIDIFTTNEKKYRIFIATNKAFIQKVAQLFLEEEKSDKETLQDITLETTNLIIGSAKVLAEKSENSYNIGTPFFRGISMFNINYDEIIVLSNTENELIIALKELDA